MEKTYRAFLFDADNTLFDYDRAEGEALCETLRAAGAVADGGALEAYRRINTALWAGFEAGTVTLAALRVERFRSLAQEVGLTADPEMLSRDDLERLAVKAHFMPHALEVIQELARVSLLCIVTNGISRVQRGRIARAGVGDLFREIVISEELGISKPDPRFFARALRGLGVRPPEALCVGDSLASDIRGARAAGIDACWYNPKGLPLPAGESPPEHTVTDLREVLPLAGL
jgi:2-haloacid dehalogenase